MIIQNGGRLTIFFAKTWRVRRRAVGLLGGGPAQIGPARQRFRQRHRPGPRPAGRDGEPAVDRPRPAHNCPAI